MWTEDVATKWTIQGDHPWVSDVIRTLEELFPIHTSGIPTGSGQRIFFFSVSMMFGAELFQTFQGWWKGITTQRLVSLLEMICFDPDGNGWKWIIIVPNLGGWTSTMLMFTSTLLSCWSSQSCLVKPALVGTGRSPFILTSQAFLV